MEDFTFKVNLVAVVRVRADDESIARKIVPAVLGAPGTAEIRLANENNAAKGHHATVTDVDFSIESVNPFRKSGWRGVTARNFLQQMAIQFLVPWRLSYCVPMCWLLPVQARLSSNIKKEDRISYPSSVFRRRSSVACCRSLPANHQARIGSTHADAMNSGAAVKRSKTSAPAATPIVCPR